MNEAVDFDTWDSKTYRVICGCGHLYITVASFEGQVVRIITNRKSNFHCDLTFFDALNRQTSFQTNRELEQSILDLQGNDLPREGHFCRKYGIGVKGAMKRGELGAFSCSDAVARVLRKEIDGEG